MSDRTPWARYFGGRVELESRCFRRGNTMVWQGREHHYDGAGGPPQTTEWQDTLYIDMPDSRPLLRRIADWFGGKTTESELRVTEIGKRIDAGIAKFPDINANDDPEMLELARQAIAAVEARKNP